jgi:hypothetical protein
VPRIRSGVPVNGEPYAVLVPAGIGGNVVLPRLGACLLGRLCLAPPTSDARDWARDVVDRATDGTGELLRALEARVDRLEVMIGFGGRNERALRSCLGLARGLGNI